MVGLSEKDELELRMHLQNAVINCSDRCLYQSAKWVAELLNSFQSSRTFDYGSDTDVDSPMSDTDASHLHNVPPVSSSSPAGISQLQLDPVEAQLEARELSRYLLAKSFFDCKEYDRCAAVFLPPSLPKGPIVPSSLSTTKTPSRSTRDRTLLKGKSKLTFPNEKGVAELRDSVAGLSQKALFLALYSKYMAGEKRKNEESEMILGPADGGITVNKELNGIGIMLEDWFKRRSEKSSETQGWLEYLYGIILLKGKNEEAAKQWLLRSVHVYPYNWGAWQELSSLIGTTEQLNDVAKQLPQNIMTFIFHVFTNQELCQATEQIHNIITQVLNIFPDSAFLQSQKALLFYHSKDFEEAESIFSSILQKEPHRIDSLDHYSNVLYVMNKRPKLAFVAQLATTTDKFRPETCCIAGNYYSLKSEHEKAVMYFRRALTLDRSFLSAWTLMGHEYVEMKNTHAAIESYRRAVDVNRKDYRAWYGLGQTYELLEMNSYALYYFQRAATLRPYDPKMWQAVGACLGRIDRYESAIRAYKRALVAGSYFEGSAASSFGSQEPWAGGLLDPEVLYQIAILYERLNDRNECAAYMEMVLAQEEGPDDVEDGGGGGGGIGVTPTTSKARMWLARWEFFRGGYQRSMELANELCQDGVEVEDAKALVRDIRARIEVDKDHDSRRAAGNSQ